MQTIVTTSALIHLFSLNTGSGIPIYRQLTDQIKQAIRMNLLKAGEQLPLIIFLNWRNLLIFRGLLGLFNTHFD